MTSVKTTICNHLIVMMDCENFRDLGRDEQFSTWSLKHPFSDCHNGLQKFS